MKRGTTSPRLLGYLWLALVLPTASGPSAWAQSRPSARAPTPDWSQRDVSDLFFADAFREGLRGERPQQFGAVTDATESTAVPSGPIWSPLVSARTLEDEVKRIAGEIRAAVRQGGQISGPSAVQASEQLQHLATVFGIMSSYEGEVRWKSIAGTAAQKLASLSSAVAEGQGDALQEASEILQALTRGSSSLEAGRGIESLAGLVSRAAVMQRLDHAVETRLGMALNSVTSFRRQNSEVQREAEMIVALARLLTLDGVEDALDDDYRSLCEQLLHQAQALRQAAEVREYHRAADQLGVIRNSCAACHEMYRG